jgi:lysozyme family protein
MTANSFDIALAHVLKHEGGFVDHPADPGGATASIGSRCAPTTFRPGSTMPSSTSP